MNGRFSRKTFEYFEGAAKNRKNLKWFTRNESQYESEVKLPLSSLLIKLGIDLIDDFPDISFHPRKISLPVYRTENIPEDGTIVKSFSWAYLSEKKTSLFEWNPGINIYVGQNITVGMGLYHPSSRQQKLLREKISRDPSSLTRELKIKKFQATWGELSGERYSRFPRGFDPESEVSEYLWYKQFIVSKSYTKREVLSPGFAEIVARDLKAGKGFLSWLRETAGVYERKISPVAE